MKLSNLKAGQTYKNYKELCNALEEPIKSSDSKNAQLNMWKKYFSWKREKQKYIITEIYDLPLEVDLNSNTYSNAMYPIIIYNLYQNSLEHKSANIYLPTLLDKKFTFFKMFGYSNVFYQKPTMPHISDYFIYDSIYENWYNVINYPFTRALDLLVKENKIQYQNRYYVYYSKGTEKRLASDAHTKIIESNIELILEEMNFKSLYEVYSKGKDVAFFEKLNSYLEQYGYVYGSKLLEISLPQKKRYSLMELDKKYGINVKYIKLFGDKSEKEIEHIVEDCRRKINDLILAKAYIKNEENLEKFSFDLSRPVICNKIYETLKKDYGGNQLTTEAYIKIYKERLEAISKIIFQVPNMISGGN